MDKKQVLSEQDTGKGYVIRREIVEGFGDKLEMESAYSTIDDGYIGSLDTAKRLCDERGIRPERMTPESQVCSIGFCDKEQKWYGWSHRAIFGFGVGSTVKRGDCAYIADTPEGLIEERAAFFSDISAEVAERKRAECQILPDRSGIRILHEPLVIPVLQNASDIGDAINGDEVPMGEVDISPGFSIQKCGRGEWTAQSLEDAKQMAKDFAESVS